MVAQCYTSHVPMLTLKKALSALIFASMLLLGLPLSTFAATPSYSALRVTTTGGGAITMAPGEVKNIAVTLQNTGTETWKNDGAGYISLYTYGPKYRASVFDPGTWLSPSQVKRLSEASVKPGAVGTLLFSLKAPQTAGAYKEEFNLAAEGLAWVPGGNFTLTINVKSATSAATSSSSASSSTVTSTDTGYHAVVVTQTATKLKVLAKKPVSFAAVIKNTGTRTWQTVGLSAAAMTIASTNAVPDDFAHRTWSGSQVALLTQSVKPGDSATVQFFFTAPATNGTHEARFQITADNQAISDTFVELPVEVTGGSAAALNSPVDTNNVTPSQLITEPTIRVGVLIVDEETNNEIYVTSNESSFTLEDTNHIVLGTFSAGKKVEAAYQSGYYVYNDGTGVKNSTLPLRFVPATPSAVMTITNFDRTVTRNAAKPYNTFRNVLEIRYNTPNDRTWVINELPIEYYLRGLAETSNSSPVEFQKALLTAARTYAYYHWTHATKHASEGFHVDAYRDQVYWGYGQEEQTPLITAGVVATKGDIVTYGGATAITPYFSRSDGHTRNWSDVWGGDVPWCKSVSVPADVGRTLWGHGVGMSASGALAMAKAGQDWKTILKYFYTGVDITERW